MSPRAWVRVGLFVFRGLCVFYLRQLEDVCLVVSVLWSVSECDYIIGGEVFGGGWLF